MSRTRSLLRGACLLLLAALVAVPLAPVGAHQSEPAVYAHRGGAGLYPENTLGAFRAAHDRWGERGVWLEMDSYVALDGELVIIHDEMLDRTTDCTGPVTEKTSDELQDCDAAHHDADWPDHEPVPRARDVLTEGIDAGWRILFELKNIPGEGSFDPVGSSFAQPMADLLADTEFPPDRIVVQSFWPPTLDRVKELVPGIRTALLTTSQLPGAPPAVGFWAHQNAVYSTANGYDVVAPDHTSPDLDHDTVTAIQSLGKQVVLWTVNAPCDILRAHRWGVDGIISDRPDLVYDAIDGNLACIITP